jgi:glycosyltransferase involved in cell wall biosynthesis
MNNRLSSKHPRRHCMVVHAYYPIGETRVEREACALTDRGFEVDVICLAGKNEPAVEVKDEVNIYRLPVKRYVTGGLAIQLFEYLVFFFLAFFKLVALHRQRRYRVVQVHNLPDFLIFAGLVPKLAGARLILDIHDLMPEFYAARFNTSLKSWPVRLVHWQEQLACRFADHVITVTEPWRQTLIGRGLPPEKVSVVMNVADDRVFCRVPQEEQPTKDDGRFRLIYHGTLNQRYGLDLAIQAIGLVKEEIPDIHLVIHGRGTHREMLKKLVDELGLGEQVHFSTDFVPTAELPKVILQAQVGVVPYRRDVFTDGILPTKLMEYAALGIPAIAAQTPAIAAYFDETMVQFFAPEDVQDLARSIVALYSDPERLALLAAGAEKFNRRYNWSKVGAEYVALVERLGSRKGLS